MMFTIDYDRVREILDQNPPLDTNRKYYLQYSFISKIIKPLVPNTRQLLQATFTPAMHVVDVGCGRGDTLLDSATLFRWGTGIDESEDVMIAAANEAKARRGIRNVEFRFGKAANLPIGDESVDLIFSERGPLGHNDITLREALRVLRPGGLIFIETMGETHSWETAAAFDPNYKKPTSLLGVLEQERDRFERHDIRIHSLASMIQVLQFNDFYEWLKFQCYTWNYPERELLSVDCRDQFEKLICIASDRDGQINITNHIIWIAGTKAV